MNKFNVIIVEDVMLELRGTVEIFKNEIPEANIIGTAQNEEASTTCDVADQQHHDDLCPGQYSPVYRRPS